MNNPAGIPCKAGKPYVHLTAALAERCLHCNPKSSTPPPTPVSVVRTEKHSSVTVIITGQLGDVLRAISAEFTNYHPYGYGTFVERISHQSGDVYQATMLRSNSCD